MKLGKTLYNIEDVLLVNGSELKIERALTVNFIQIRIKKVGNCNDIEIWYGFKESKWMHLENDIVRKIT